MPETKHWIDKATFAAEIAGLIALIIYAYLTYDIRSANQRAADTASRQLEMQDRPWLKDTVTPASDLLANNGAFSWAVQVRLDNVGHSVATGIFPRTELIAPKGADFIDGPRKRVTELCKDASQRAANIKKDPALWNGSIFPGDAAVYMEGPILFPKDINSAIIDGGATLGKSVPIMLVGCVVYDFPTALGSHETGFVYLVSHADDPSLPQPSQVFFSVVKTIPKDKIILKKDAQFAN